MSQIFDYLSGRSARKQDQLNEPLFVEDEYGKLQQEDTQSSRSSADDVGFLGGFFKSFGSKVDKDHEFEGGDHLSFDAKKDTGASILKQFAKVGVIKDLINERAIRNTPEYKAKLMDEVNQKFLPYQTMNDKDFYIFEPKGFVQKFKALLQNTYEIQVMLGVILLSFFDPQYCAILILFMTWVLIFTSVYETESRIIWGCVMLFILAGTDAYFVLLKFQKINKMVSDPSMESFHNKTSMDKSILMDGWIGLQFTNVTTKAVAGEEWTYQISIWQSFIFEAGVMIIVIIGMFYMFRHHECLEDYKQKKMQVLMIKNYEVENQDSEEEEETLHIGTGDLQRNTQSEEVKKKKEKQVYENKIQAMSKEITRNYVGCQWFKKSNKLIFLILIISQIGMAMGFNSVIDVPTLILIVFLFASFSVRKMAPQFYAIFTFFMVYYINFVSLVKVIYVIITQIPYIKAYRSNPSHAKYASVVYSKLLFGLDFSGKGEQELAQKLYYYFWLILILFSSHVWKQQKWAQVRDVLYGTKYATYNGFSQVCKYSIKSVKEKTKLNLLEEMAKKEQKMKERKAGGGKQRKVNQKFKKSALTNLKTDFESFMPTLLCWIQRILLGFQSYLYCNELGMLHLFWVLCSFCVNTQVLFFMSAIFMIPTFTWEFVMIYSTQIEMVKQSHQFSDYGGWYFNWKLYYPCFEQMLYFVIMTIFWMMLGYIYNTFEAKQDNYIFQKFKEKITKKDTSLNWKFLFFFLQKVHLMVLITLFYMGSQDINRFPNLMFIIFFVVYATWESLYRKTSFILSVFVSYLIFAQYYFNLEYHYYQDNKLGMYKKGWFGFFKCEQYTMAIVKSKVWTWQKIAAKCNDPTTFPQWKVGSPINFRATPYLFDWGLLLIMSVLNQVNFFFQDPAQSQKLENIAYERIRDDGNSTGTVMYILMRIRNFSKRYIKFLVLWIMCLVNMSAQTNLITWVFWASFIILVCLVAKGDKKDTTMVSLVKVTDRVKSWSFFVTFIDVLFISMIGEYENKSDPNSYDQKFKKLLPGIYRQLDLIGFRVMLDPNHGLCESLDPHACSNPKYAKEANCCTDTQSITDNTRSKFYTYIVYLILSIYMNGLFTEEKQQLDAEKTFSEDDYKKLFEFRETNSDDEDDNLRVDDAILGTEAESEIKDKSPSQITSKKKDKKKGKQEQEQAFFLRKQVYQKNDLKDRVEFRRFSMPYIVYKNMDYWPLFDSIAKYGHIILSLIIVKIAIDLNVSIFMAFNIACVCSYYLIATYRLSKKAARIYRLSGLQTQTDLNKANIISKQYTIQSTFEFLKIRTNIWKIQIGVLAFCAIIGFPTTLLDESRSINKFNARQLITEIPTDSSTWNSTDSLRNQTYHKTLETIRMIDDASFWCFIIGIWKDKRPEVASYYYWTYGLLFIGLMIEKQAINWLTNRWGCNYNKVQKFVELETRNQAIEENWKNMPAFIPYGLHRYEQHYFYNDYKNLENRFKETIDESNHLRQQSRHTKDLKAQEVREFVPYKVAVRIKDTIQFSTRLDGRDDSLKLSDATLQQLDKRDKQMLEFYKNRDEVENLQKMFEKAILEDKLDQAVEGQERQITRHGKHHIQTLSKSIILKEEEKLQHEFDQIQDYESIEVLKKHKIAQHEKIIKQAIDTKYKISLSKGLQLIVETLCLFVLMISIIMKANIFSIIYISFIFKYILSKGKCEILVRMTTYISICLSAQYLLYMLNLTHNTNPSPYPVQFTGYPMHDNKAVTNTDKYIVKDSITGAVVYSQRFFIPFFFQFDMFHDMKLSYLIGIGIEKDQIQNLLLDFLNLYLVSMYVLLYRNPLLTKSMKKVFWQFPSNDDPKEKWDRLDPEVRKQVIWYQNPVELANKEFNDIQNMIKGEKNGDKMANEEFEFSKKFKNMEIDLNEKLITYIDMKYKQIWSQEFCRKIKWQMKEASIYFRLVKQGSIIVYLCFHVLTILFVLFMAVIRQSFISLGYVIMILPHMKSGADVLRQNLLGQNKIQIKIESEIEELKQKIKNNDALIEEYGDTSDQYLTDLKKKKEDVKEEIEIKKDELREIKNQKKGAGVKTQEQKLDEKVDKDTREWRIIKLIKWWLLAYALIDYTLQVVIQLPLFPETMFAKNLGHIIGFRKIYKQTGGDIILQDDFNFKQYEESNLNGNNPYYGLDFLWIDFYVVILNCFMFCFISLQCQIFESFGYKKFVEQKDGSMDLLVELSVLKAKSNAFVFNNYKIRKIVSIKFRKEQIMATVEVIKDKLKRWRAFTKTTLDVSNKMKPHQLSQRKSTLTKTQCQEQLRKKSILNINNLIMKNIADDFGVLDLEEKLEEQKVKHSHEQEKEHEHSQVVQDFPQKQKVYIDETQNEAHGDYYEDIDLQVKVQPHRVNQDQQNQLLDILIKQFVNEKKKKLNCLAKVYLFLNDYFVEKILFKNKPDQLKQLLLEQSTGSVETPTELEVIMKEDAEYLIKEKYDNKDGAKDMQRLILQTKKSVNKDFLKLTNFDRKIKLSMMTRTWEFTRTGSILYKILETLVYMIISNTQGLLYLSFVFSMFQNSGMISLVYTFSMFGYALIEEVRPRKFYWEWIRVYTIFILLAKMIFNLAYFKEDLDTPTVVNMFAYLKPGFYVYSNLNRITIYMMPEILITGLLMFNEIHLKLMGLFYVIELDVESVQDGISRINCQGNEEIVRLQKIERANMNISDYFEGLDEQIAQQNEIKESELRDFKAENTRRELAGDEPLIKEPEEIIPLKDQQIEAFKKISEVIYDSSYEFDLDMFSAQEDSPLDKLVSNRCLQKSLENDNIIFAEGNYKEAYFSDSKENFINKAEQDQDFKAQCMLENHSAGDFSEEFEEKNGMIDLAASPDLGLFDTNKF